MLASTQNLLAWAAVLPLLTTAAPFVKRSDVKPFYLKPNKDQSQLMMVVLDAGEAIYGGAPVSIRSLDLVEDDRVIYDRWELAGTQLKLTGTEYCLDATGPHPSSFTKLEIWPCNEALPAQDWQYTPIWVSADGTEQAKLSVDAGEQCLDWKDGSTEIGQAWECVVGNQNQLWIKTDDKHFNTVSSVYGGLATQVHGGATAPGPYAAEATTTAGSNSFKSLLGSPQGGSTVAGSATDLPVTVTYVQGGAPSSSLAPQISGVVSSRIGQATATALAGGTTTALRPGATSIPADKPSSSSIGRPGNIGATSIAAPIVSSSFVAPAVPTVVVGGTLARRADSVISSVLEEVVNGYGATSTRAEGAAPTSSLSAGPVASYRATGGLGATTSIVPAGTATSSLDVVSSSVIPTSAVPTTLVPAASSTSALDGPSPSLVLIIPSLGGFNGSAASNASEIQKWTCYRE
ncbi:hypothetical protein NCC49_004778 [Naganishia albida]|nr:hypothetical protein NCC49_004778 [Naganishia albida]